MSNERKIEHLENIINLLLDSSYLETRSDVNEILSSFGIKTKYKHISGRSFSYKPVESFMVKPLYEHDCSKCVYLGSSSHSNGMKDLYWCHQSGMPTVISRSSSDGPDYVSGSSFSDVNYSIAVAVGRAKSLGLSI